MEQANTARPELLALSGEIGVGKSTVAHLVGQRVADCGILSARLILAELTTSEPVDRHQLQVEGALLEEETRGNWLAEYIEKLGPSSPRWVLDSVRTRRQAESLLSGELSTRLVYLTASKPIRRLRFESSKGDDLVKASMSFERASRHPTELEVRNLLELADLVIDTSRLEAREVVDEIRAWSDW